MRTLTLAICDSNPGQMNLLRTLCTGIAIRADIEIQLLRFSGEQIEEKLLRYSATINLALISLDIKNGLSLGCALSRQNSDCYLLFYSEKPYDLEPLFWARPIAFHAGPLVQDTLEPKILAICNDLFRRSGMLQYNSRSLTGLLPYRFITCVESDRKHLRIHIENGQTLQLYGKLDDLERKMADGPFCRVHQSWLVNLNRVICLDRTQHLLYLGNGEAVPVSKAHYERVTNVFGAHLAQNDTGGPRT